MTPIRTISREEAKPLIESKQLLPAGLYEPQHNKKDEFVYVDFGNGYKRFYKLVGAGRWGGRAK